MSEQIGKAEQPTVMAYRERITQITKQLQDPNLLRRASRFLQYLYIYKQEIGVEKAQKKTVRTGETAADSTKFDDEDSIRAKA